MSVDDAADTLARSLERARALRDPDAFAAHRVDEHAGEQMAGSLFDRGGVANTVARSKPASKATRSSIGVPTVSVPVLSKTAVFTSLSASSAPPCRMITKRRAARLIPPMIATGVARISGHGVATTRMASARIQSCVSQTAMPQIAIVIGVNQTAYRSASR